MYLGYLLEPCCEARKIFVVSLVLYFAGAAVDIAMTLCFVLGGAAAEGNPFVSAVLGRPLLWFARDILTFGLAALMAYVLYRLVIHAAYERSFEQERLLEMAPKCLYTLTAVSIARWLPVVHNVLVLAGIDTPIDDFIKMFLGLWGA